MTRIKQCVAIALVVAAAVGAGNNMIRRATIGSAGSSDFRVFLAAAQETIHGGLNLYTFTDSQGLHYIYPPTFAVLMTPFTALRPSWAATAWYLLNLLLLAASLIFTVRILTPEGTARSWGILFFPLIITAEPTLATLTRGQVGIVMLASCVFALYFYRRGRPFLSGLLIAFATILKIYTGVIFFYFLIRRDWRALAGSAAGAIVFGFLIPASVFGGRLTMIHWRVWITTIVLPFLSTKAEVTPLYGELQNLDIMRNQSMLATMKHFGTIAGIPESGVGWIKFTALVFAVAALILVALVWRRDGDGNCYRVSMQWSLALVAGLILIPVSWIHYYCLMIFPLAIVSSYLHFGADGPARRAFRLCSVVLGTLCALSIVLTGLDGPLHFTPWYDVIIVERSTGLIFWEALVTGAVFFYLLAWRVQMPLQNNR